MGYGPTKNYAVKALRRKRCPVKCRPEAHKDWEYCWWTCSTSMIMCQRATMTDNLFDITWRQTSLTRGLPRAGNSAETLFTAPARADSDIDFRVWDCDIKVHFRYLCTFVPTSTISIRRFDGLLCFKSTCWTINICFIALNIWKQFSLFVSLESFVENSL